MSCNKMLHFTINNRNGLPMPGDVTLPQTQKPAPVIILLAGQNGFTTWGFYPYLAQRLSDAGFAVVNFNFSMAGVRYGEDHFSDLDLYERNTPTAEIDDTEDVIQALSNGQIPGKESMDVTKLGLYSHSLGCGVALITSQRCPSVIKFLALWAPIATLQVWPPSDMEKWKQQGFLEMPIKRTNQTLKLGAGFYRDVVEADKRFNIMDAAKAIDIPTLLVHGSVDESVPVSHSEDIFAALKGADKELRIVPGAGHTFGAKHPYAGTTPQLEDAVTHTVAWLVEQVD